MADQSGTGALGLSSGLGLASDALGLVEGGVQLFTSLADQKKKERELNSLKQPFYKIQDEYLQNRNLAADQAQGGLPSATKDYLTSESQRGLGAGVSGILQSGGSPNDINKLFDTYSRSIDRTAAQDAEMHKKNIDYFMNVNKDLAGQKTMQWALNKYQPYQEKKKQLTEGIAADKLNAYGGANTAIGSVGAAGTSLENNGLLNLLFKEDSNRAAPYNPSVDYPTSTSYNPAMVSSTGYIDPHIKTPTFNG